MWHFYKTPAVLQKVFPSLLWRVDTSDKIIYLTFDDGPIPRLTPWILNELKKFGAKATFFCVGDNIRKHPEVFSMLLNDGHAIGNHTFNHLKAWTTKTRGYLDNLHKCDAELEQGGGDLQKLFRPPHGQISPGLIRKIKKTHTLVMWDVLTYDFSKTHSAEAGLKQAIEATKPGSIVVFHDNYKAEEKLKYMLPGFLTYFSDMGFRFNNLNDIGSQSV